MKVRKQLSSVDYQVIAMNKIWMFFLFLWFFLKKLSYIYIDLVWFGFFVFNGISTFVGYVMPKLSL